MRGEHRINTLTRGLRALWMGLIVLGAAGLALGASAQEERERAADGGVVRVAEVTGAIGPATTRYLTGAIEESDGARALVIALDTPGGLDAALRDINQAILNADTPVVVYVTPSGARAASAGLYMLYASHVAAMTPGTSTGAATPVAMGGGGGGSPMPSPAPESPPADAGPDGEASGEAGAADEGSGDTSDEASEGASDGTAGAPADGAETGPAAPGNEEAMRNKVVNDAVAYIRSLAELRGRNADWAEAAVREAATVTAEEALELGVIEVIASDLDDLLDKLDGREAEVNGRIVVLETAGAAIETVEMTFAEQILTVITNPNIAFLLLNLGFIGLLVSFYNGLEPITLIAGLICLIVGFYALNTLPLNYAGAALVVLGLALLIAEAFVASYGLLTLGGLIAFALGALMLVDTDVEALRLDWRFVAALTVAVGGSVVLMVSYGLAAQGRKTRTGAQGLVGAEGEVTEWDGGAGYVRVAGEIWKAESKEPLAAGDRVVVAKVDGLKLQVRKAK